MIGLDTNVLVRYVVQDDVEQAEAAGRLIEGQCTRESPGLVGGIVLAELVRVLRGAYGYDKALLFRWCDRSYRRPNSPWRSRSWLGLRLPILRIAARILRTA